MYRPSLMKCSCKYDSEIAVRAQDSIAILWHSAKIKQVAPPPRPPHERKISFRVCQLKHKITNVSLYVLNHLW